MGYFDYEDERYQKGYVRVTSNLQDFCKKNIGKKICYLVSMDYNQYRGYVFPRYAYIHSVKRNEIFIEDGHNSFNVKDVLELAYKDE
jgi:hypothetical protein